MDLASALGPRPGDRRPWLMGQLLDVDEVGLRAQVSLNGGDAVWLPYVPAGDYAGVDTVFVLMDPHGSGAGQLVLGPGSTVPEPPAPPPPPPPAPDEQDPADPELPQLVTATAVIRPTWSGTYRVIRGAYDRWNTSRYGGRSTLYQGDAFGSGDLIGLAVYGDQVRNLGALAITRIVVSTPLATGSGGVVLQGATNGTPPSGAPSTTGGTVSGDSTTWLSAAQCEDFRTGGIKGLATVGSNYRATRGTSHPSGMALTVTYQRPA